ncbi:appr-1-p processing domain-containing protein [Thecamonas trahens ATCC 50062]|uniref:Appr-1-p processing domain-containing protein n=1 Tax=Thecamonas trahens ATCC 50062 TaxID=461836 RepID=A0A0L0DID1_THETB|nr:appr-1-p processing domain-containing protein [Thecamonas trahens ATCC 50062]KNC52114.1 appr-1-p processing domain-containing protein [Thecamonas trahens ATCC 50062]|eukprot:XP_013762118.1 appr-1-p processing domain-containing protein [Thecamonas trahens ATCC 50062]
MNKRDKVVELARYFANELGYRVPTATRLEARESLRALLTVRPPGPVNDDEMQAALDDLLRAEVEARGIVQPRAAAGKTQVGLMGLWRGDIRLVAADVVVNPANSALLGCFRPEHKCVDNILHAAGGPAIRAECAERRAHGDAEPVGSALLTTAGVLPAQYMAHTVGPQISGPVTAANEAGLAACYTSVLDAAAAVDAASVAFPCISTGLFAFPKRRAAEIAVATVSDWLAARKVRDAPDIFVLFVAYTDDDEAGLAAALGLESSTTEAAAAARTEAIVARVAAALAAADGVLVTCGAGLSAAAGVDYTSAEVHARFFPDMVARGYTNMYQYIGGAPRDPAVKWGYLARQVKEVRFGTDMIVHDTYDRLRTLVGDLPYFCLTSNVDGLLHRLGHFDPRRVVERQGSYALMQCLESECSSEPWPSEPELDRLRASLADDGTTSAPPPVCPVCGSENVFLNVRGGAWFDERPREAAEADLAAFLDGFAVDDNLIVLEIGVGYNTPTVIRRPNEQLVARQRGATLIRINTDHAHAPEAIESQTVLVPMDANAFLRAIAETTQAATE